MVRLWGPPRVEDVAPGTYRYDGAGDLAGHRFHLRVDPEGRGVLLVDAAKLLFLNATALDYVRFILEGKADDEIVEAMRNRYRKLGPEKALRDLAQTRQRLSKFLEGDMTVVRFVGSEDPSIGADGLPSPYRMDLALTYRCQNRCGHCYNEQREKEELSEEQWGTVLERLWEAGIPHVVFTGGEPTLSPHLEALIRRSEELGQITGLITNGRGLREDGYVGSLVEAGLDHVQITLLSHRESLHDELTGSEGSWAETVDGIGAALSEDLYVSSNTTIMRANLEDIEDTMRYLVGLGVRNVAFNGIIRSGKGVSAEGVTFEELKAVLQKVAAIADGEGVNLVWYSPTPYCEFNPVNYGLGIKQCTACSINMAVEPDGTVLPCQSYYHGLGNILTDPWEGIWGHELCSRLRRREYLPEECQKCNLADVCGGGCPLALEQGDYICLDRHSSM